MRSWGEYRAYMSKNRYSDPGWTTKEPILLDGQDRRKDYGRILTGQGLIMVIASQHETEKWWQHIYLRTLWKYCRCTTLSTLQAYQGNIIDGSEDSALFWIHG